ncbi:MAG: 30S ribosomal protein S27ae [Thaumarchaeota archaeon]|nr:MAG: 30S ribosomal protein S27ae [Nitrososphaerota archaeon]HDD40434.1 30S ribosomal protein S27ae [Nitrososphaeria archaeon]
MGKQAQLWKKYKLEGGKLIKQVVYCPRCGRGYIMADHGDRYYCGHCHYAQYKQPEQKAESS